MYGSNIKRGIAGIIISGLAIMAASCSGGGVIGEPATTENTSDQVIEQAFTNEEMPSLEKMSSGWEWIGDIGDLIDWYSVWLSKHQSVHYGTNELDETKLVGKSPGVYNFEDDGKDYINFPASGIGMNYAVFGLKDVPEGAIIRGIRFTTDFNSSESEDAAYYVAYSNYDQGVYQWYGPFAEGDIELYNFFTDTINDQDRGYFTIAVTGNNYYSDVTDVEVVIEDPINFRIPELIEKQPIPNWWLIGEDGRVDWDILWERPEIEELGVQLQIAF